MPAATSPLSDEDVRRALAGLPGWTGSPAGLERTWRFASFADAIAFMGACVEPIEALNHHPEWANVYDRVVIRLRTHDAGDAVTEADVELARSLDERARASGAR